MKNKLIWKILMCAGAMVLLLPLITGFYSMMMESWSLFDWLILYSYVYWPTYIVGVLMIVLSAYKLKRRRI